MDPLLKLWMFENWIEDQNEEIEMVKNHAYLSGSFVNPQAVQKMMGMSGQTHSSSDEELAKSMEMVRKQEQLPIDSDNEIKVSKPKRRRKLKR